MSNGLGSPACERGLAPELGDAERRHCETSGFLAAAAPTGDYGIDVHIDTGVLGLSEGGLLSVVQDLVITPLWMALVWVVHAAVVMLEWCFTLDLLTSSVTGELGRGLRQMERSITEPWLPLVLAVAAVIALYRGLIRRRVADTLGEALLMGTMMVAALWIISDPSGTVGALGGWAGQAALGTLAAAVQGSPAHAQATLGRSLDAIFTVAVEDPWCYLEFGDVAWCREPTRLDPRLRGAALRIAAAEQALVGCSRSSAPLAPCATRGSGPARALERGAQLLREARSNGAIFLALPANGAARNSINASDSLLRTICDSTVATSCNGPAAAQAEFRTGGQTWSRLGGLLLIAGGLLGMLLLLGFLALRLLSAAIFSLFYLLLSPAMLLAPAFGEAGRALFRRWGAQLLGAVVAKLLFSFLLGVVLAVLGVIAGLTAIGWWTQWLLMSALWWGAYTRRHQALGAPGGALGSAAPRDRHTLTRVLSEAPLRTLRRRRSSSSKRVEPAPAVQERRQLPPGAPAAEKPSTPDTPRETAPLRAPSRQAPTASSTAEKRLSARQAQRERVRRAEQRAEAAGDARRVAELVHRGQRIDGEIAVEVSELERIRAHPHAAADDGAARQSVRAAAAEAPEHTQGRSAVPQREPPASAAGEAQRQSRRASAAREEIERERALRQELGETRKATLRRSTSAPPRGPADPVPPLRPGSRAAQSQSSVMRDAREVEAGRKRQLGRDKP